MAMVYIWFSRSLHSPLEYDLAVIRFRKDREREPTSIIFNLLAGEDERGASQRMRIDPQGRCHVLHIHTNHIRLWLTVSHHMKIPEAALSLDYKATGQKSVTHFLTRLRVVCALKAGQSDWFPENFRLGQVDLIGPMNISAEFLTGSDG